MPSVYLESTIVSYLAARPSRDLIAAANQQLTHVWWSEHSPQYDLYVSQAVVAECQSGNSQAASQRLSIIRGLPILDISPQTIALAEKLISQIPLPPKANIDALHIALAAVNGIDYLLTWNCTHIANAIFLHKIEEICKSSGYLSPTVCTPNQLMEGQ